MTNGDTSTTWQFRDGLTAVSPSTYNTASMMNNNNHVVESKATTTTASLHGMGDSSIVKPGENRRSAGDKFPGSDNFGRLPTVDDSINYSTRNSAGAHYTTVSDVTRNRSRADTTSAFDSSSSVPRPHHENQLLFSQHPSEQQFHNDNQSQQQHPFTSNTYSTDPISQLESSDLHLDPSSLIPSSFRLDDSNSSRLEGSPFSPPGNREALWNSHSSYSSGARLGAYDSQQQLQQRPSSTLTTQSSQTQQHSNQNSSGSNNINDQNHNLALSSTPQQSNLSKSINNIANNKATDLPSLRLSPDTGMGHSIATSWALESVDNGSSHGSTHSSMMDRNNSTPEGKNRDGDDSTVQSTAVLSVGGQDVGDHLSPASSPRLNPSSGGGQAFGDNVDPLLLGQPTTAIIGTPSTVSTEPSTTEDASLGPDLDKIGLKQLDLSHMVEPFTLHRRAPSWDRSPTIQHQLYQNTEISASMQQQPRQPDNSQPYWGAQQQQPQGPSYANRAAQQQQQHPWGSNTSQSQSRVASFRNEDMHDSRSNNYHAQQQQQQQQQQYTRGPQPDRWLPGPRPYPGSEAATPHQYPVQMARAGAHMQQQQQQPHPGYGPFHPSSAQRKAGYPPQHPMPPSQSPQRVAGGRGVGGVPRPQGGGPSPHRQQQQAGSSGSVAGNPALSTGGGGGGSSRSSSEILKTLLRKKACLYEPDTSRAVALVTWLVGRELALDHGYFSRQQLQAGVHACVAEKIEAGTITRTKVNRCMQIILNSCFHYIIPRPDGTEEKGHTFKAQFAREIGDDNSLLRILPAPWNDLKVNKDIVLEASMAELEGKSEPRSSHASPKGSPSLKPMDHRSPTREHHHDTDADSKRAVLLCFNENVRSAEDVFRCHNEFIRDSAHSSNLQLTAHEWRIFFGKDAASTPHIWGNVGIPVVSVDAPNGGARKIDALGQMTPVEAGKFRTTWCAKRYDHDHEFCGMAHVEVNGGWLRRNPNVHWYKAEVCPNIINMADKRTPNSFFAINECPKGINCEYSHSREEMVYHPNQYKSTVCEPIRRTGGCRFGDICPHHHPSDSVRPAGKKGDRSGSRHGRSSAQSSNSGKNTHTLPAGAPILYASPAPSSSFEKHLLMPGLQNLYRRQCTVVRAYVRNPKCRSSYSYFGDDAGIGEEANSRPKPKPGLPPSQP